MKNPFEQNRKATKVCGEESCRVETGSEKGGLRAKQETLAQERVAEVWARC